MTIAADFVKFLSRASSHATHGLPADRRLGAKADRARALLVAAARDHAARRLGARRFTYLGRTLRLHTFNGWLIVLRHDGRPLAGPVRILQGEV